MLWYFSFDQNYRNYCYCLCQAIHLLICLKYDQEIYLNLLQFLQVLEVSLLQYLKNHHNHTLCHISILVACTNYLKKIILSVYTKFDLSLPQTNLFNLTKLSLATSNLISNLQISYLLYFIYFFIDTLLEYSSIYLKIAYLPWFFILILEQINNKIFINLYCYAIKIIALRHNSFK